MRKLFIATMLIFLSISVFSQEIDIKDTFQFKVMVGNTEISNHYTKSNALQSFINTMKLYPGADVKIIGLGEINVDIPDDFFIGKTDTIYHTDTLYEPGTVDTINISTPTVEFKTIDANVIYVATLIDSSDNAAIYGILDDGSGGVIKLKDTLGLHVNSVIGKCNYKTFKMKLNVTEHSYGENSYVKNYELDQPFFHEVLYAERSQDSTQITTQTYFNQDWEFSKRGSNNREDLEASEWTAWGFQAGNPFPNIWRHSQTFKTKYFQTRARSKVTGEIHTCQVRINSMFKGTLKLTDLRIDLNNSGVARIRVTGNEVCEMNFFYAEVGTVGWKIVPPEISYDYASHGMDVPNIKHGTSYNLMARGRDINGLDIMIMMPNVLAP
jgi:hypothetical protein